MTAPTAQEIAEVDAGINDRLVEAAAEARDADQFIAGMQDRRDDFAVRGDFDQAEAWDAEIGELLAPEAEAAWEPLEDVVELDR